MLHIPGVHEARRRRRLFPGRAPPAPRHPMSGGGVCYLDGDMRGRRWHLPAAVAILVPGILAGWTLTAVSAEQASPSPNATAAQLPGDPTAGAQVYSGKGGW